MFKVLKPMSGQGELLEGREHLSGETAAEKPGHREMAVPVFLGVEKLPSASHTAPQGPEQQALDRVLASALPVGIPGLRVLTAGGTLRCAWTSRPGQPGAPPS